MSARSTLIETAATLVDTNPAAAKFIVNLSNAETGAEMIDAIDAYDQEVLDANTEVVAVQIYIKENLTVLFLWARSIMDNAASFNRSLIWETL